MLVTSREVATKSANKMSTKTTTMMQEQEQRPQEQENTRAAWKITKPIFENNYLEGEARDAMQPREVIALCPEIYGKVNATNFATNWKAMRKRYGHDRKRSEEDEVLFLHDITIHTLATDYLPGYWDRS